MPNLDGVLKHLRKDVSSVETKAMEVSSRFEALSREMESTKIDILQSYVEEQKRSTARDRGIGALIKDRRKMRNSLLLAAGSAILGGLLTRDKFEALTAGMSGFDGMVQGFGESKWRVLLGKRILVTPEETISSRFTETTWVTLDSFHKTMEELKKRALSGEKLGSLDDVISNLMKKPRLSQPLDEMCDAK